MEELHYIQMQILRELLFHPNSRFTDLNLAGLDNDHFSYHINKLIELGLVAKTDGSYSLSIDGKKYAGIIDTDNNQIEKQPKLGVMLIPVKEADGKKYFLLQQRLKEPYFGYWGCMTGKIRYGEKIYETAARELEEEMGLSGKFSLQYILHEMVYDKSTKKQLEDKFFYIIEVTDLKGELLESTPDGKNCWFTYEEFLKLSPKYHNEDDILGWYISDNKEFKEETYFIEKF